MVSFAPGVVGSPKGGCHQVLFSVHIPLLPPMASARAPGLAMWPALTNRLRRKWHCDNSGSNSQEIWQLHFHSEKARNHAVKKLRLDYWEETTRRARPLGGALRHLTCEWSPLAPSSWVIWQAKGSQESGPSWCHGKQRTTQLSLSWIPDLQNYKTWNCHSKSMLWGGWCTAMVIGHT